MSEHVEVRPYFLPDERYPSLIGVRVGGDKHETAYVSKGELMCVMDENVKLREQGARLFDKTLELGTENAELRKLMAKMAREYECGYLTLPQRLADRMRELGVEVDGC